MLSSMGYISRLSCKCPGVMEYFHKYMKEGDYFIIEDTNPEWPSTGGQCQLDLDYQRWGNEKLNLLKNVLHKYDGYYQVDSYYTEFFGYNGTYNWDGYIKRIKWRIFSGKNITRTNC